MKNYIGTKQVKAKPFTFTQWEALAKENSFHTNPNVNKNEEGYLVEYLDSPNSHIKGFDNYVSWSPKEVFEKAYYPTEGMTFGQAIEALRMGLSLARASWESDHYIEYYPEGEKGSLTRPVYPRLVLWTSVHKHVFWVPLVEDLFASDWQISD